MLKPVLFAILACLAMTASAQPVEPVRIIFDTDMGNDIDDALALAVLHGLESRGDVKLLAVTVTKDNPWAPVFVSAVDTFYGRGAIPIGIVHGGKTPDDGKYVRQVSEMKDAKGSPLYPRGLSDVRQAPDAVSLLRRILAGEKDGAVTLVQVGFSTNLARLLDSKPDDASPLDGRALVSRKVRLLSAMAGQFPTGNPEYNIKIDLPASQKLFAAWPTPVVASGFEIGEAIRYPAVSIERDFAWSRRHPVVDAYRAYDKMPYDRQTWDLTAVLYAARPDRGYFGLSAPGKIVVDGNGRTRLEASAQGRHRYLTVTPEQAQRVQEAFAWICSQPPR